MPNPTNNKLVDSKTIAALFDMTPRRVQQLTKDGVIAAVKEGNANRYDLLPTIQRYIRYLTAKANGREPSKKDSEIEGRRLEAEADLKRSKADIAALQLSELEGTMHRSEDVEAVMTDLVYNIRSMLVALPGRLAVDVTALFCHPRHTGLHLRKARSLSFSPWHLLVIQALPLINYTSP